MNTRFLGKVEIGITDGDRVVVPSKFRQKGHLDEGFFVSTHNSGWLEIRTASQLTEIEQKLDEIFELRKEYRDFARVFYANLEEANLDKQGRFVLSKEMKGSLFTKKETDNLIIVGVGKWLEIWTKDLWDIQESGQSSKSAQESVINKISYLIKDKE
jgi:MraZ protein